MSKWGALSGAMQGADKALNIWLTSEMEKQKEQRLQSYADQRYQQQRADQLADKASDREYAQGVLGEERKYQAGRDAKKHEQALELAKQKGKAEQGDKSGERMFEAKKLEYQRLSEADKHYRERMADPTNPLSEDETKKWQNVQTSLNELRREMQNLPSGKSRFNLEGALKKAAGSTPDELRANIDFVRENYGDEAARRFEVEYNKRIQPTQSRNLSRKQSSYLQPPKHQNQSQSQFQQPHQALVF